MGYSNELCTVFSILISVFVLIFCALRLYVRVWLLKPGLDDAFLLIAVVLYIPLMLLYVIGLLKYGIGQRNEDLSHETYKTSIQILLSCQLLYPVATYLVKQSFMSTLFRITRGRVYTVSLYVILGAGIVSTVFIFFWYLLACRPMRLYWEQMTDPNLQGSCRTVSDLTVVSLVHAGWNLIADLLLGLVIPALLLRSIQMQLRTKISVLALLSLGSVASVATVARIVYLPTLTQQDGLYTNNKLIFWTVTEVGISLVCTCATALKPLMVKIGIIPAGTHPEGSEYSGAPPGTCQGIPLQYRREKWPKISSRVEFHVHTEFAEDMVSHPEVDIEVHNPTRRKWLGWKENVQ